MTVIACKVYDSGKLEIASDSIAARGYTKTSNVGSNSKLFRVNNLIVGATGTSQECMLFRTFLQTHNPARNNEDAILDMMSEFADWKNDKTGLYGIENHYFVCVDNVPYYVENFLVQRVETFEAIGIGMDFALAAMELGHSPREAVEVAIKLSVYCAAPIIEYNIGV